MLEAAYPVLKLVHIAAVVISGAGFVTRWIAGCRGAAWVRSRPARILPHIVDTVLLASSVTLAITAGFSPANSPWLTAKLVALVVYIGLGMVALKPVRPLPVRIAAGLGAVIVVAYIVAVALTKQPWPLGTGSAAGGII